MENNIRNYYCVVTQEEADEAKELLVQAGEPAWDHEWAFLVTNDCYHLALDALSEEWYVSFFQSNTLTTYPEFKQMLINKIEENGNNTI